MLLSELSDGDYSDLVDEVLEHKTTDLKSIKLRIESGAYKKLYWSRICSLQLGTSEPFSRFPIEEDLL